MFTCFGWANLRTTTYESDERGEQALAVSFEAFVRERFGECSSFEYKIRHSLNWVGPTFMLMCCFNHRDDDVVELFRWLGQHGPGSFGLLYVHDDEDRRGGMEFGNCFRVWRLARGQLTEMDDPFMSPCIPLLEDPFDPNRPDEL